MSDKREGRRFYGNSPRGIVHVFHDQHPASKGVRGADGRRKCKVRQIVRQNRKFSDGDTARHRCGTGQVLEKKNIFEGKPATPMATRVDRASCLVLPVQNEKRDLAIHHPPS